MREVWDESYIQWLVIKHSKGDKLYQYLKFAILFILSSLFFNEIT